MLYRRQIPNDLRCSMSCETPWWQRTISCRFAQSFLKVDLWSSMSHDCWNLMTLRIPERLKIRSCFPHFGSLLTGHVIRSNGTLALSYQSFMSCSQLIFQFTCGVEPQRIKPRKDENKKHERKQKVAELVFWMRVTKSSIFTCECCCVQRKSEKNSIFRN